MVGVGVDGVNGDGDGGGFGDGGGDPMGLIVLPRLMTRVILPKTLRVTVTRHVVFFVV